MSRTWLTPGMADEPPVGFGPGEQADLGESRVPPVVLSVQRRSRPCIQF